MKNFYEIRVCENPNCRLRYPLTKGHPFGERCPKCLGNTTAVISRDFVIEPPNTKVQALFGLEVLLDNIRSAWNAGAIFRTGDCFGVQKIYLCGITPTPENPSLKKTALGADINMAWEAYPNAVEAVVKMKAEGCHIWALEQDQRSVSLQTAFIVDEHPILLIVGNEVTGVDPELLNLCERIVEIPMLGKKRSLNVEVAFGIALSTLRTSNILQQ